MRFKWVNRGTSIIHIHRWTSWSLSWLFLERIYKQKAAITCDSNSQYCWDINYNILKHFIFIISWTISQLRWKICTIWANSLHHNVDSFQIKAGKACHDRLFLLWLGRYVKRSRLYVNRRLENRLNGVSTSTFCDYADRILVLHRINTIWRNYIFKCWVIIGSI